MIVPLGSEYIELITVVDEEAASRSAVGRFVQAALSESEGFILWSLAVQDIEECARRIQDVVHSGERQRPDGALLRWRLTGLETALKDPGLPFFIRWDVPAPEHPAAEAAPHPVKPRGIGWIEVGGDPDRVFDWLGTQEIPVRVVPGGKGVLRIGVHGEQGEIVMPSAPGRQP
jgi:hypothetical protein